MRRFNFFVASFTIVVSMLVTAHAQDKKKDADKKAPIAPAEKAAEGWDEIDQRLVFLMVRLANTESSLEAVEKTIAASSRKQSVKLGDAKRSIGKNEKMDEKGGGPMHWSKFYGTTAEKFFYHPVDRNTTYHTTTVLKQQSPKDDNKVAEGTPSRQGLPVAQRPPQFDYIYKANQDAAKKAEDEAALLKNKIDALLERRQRLEAEQLALWVEIAFRAVAHFDLDKKPIFRFEPIVVANDADAKLHAEIMKSSAIFMRLALSILAEAPKDQAATFSRIKAAVSEERDRLNDIWLRLDVDATDKDTNEGKFAALAKRLDELASNLSESYLVAMEGDQAQDQQRKDTFRGLFQESLLNYAEIVLALDEMSEEMKKEWKIKPDLDKPLPTISLAKYASVEIPKAPIPVVAKGDDGEQKPAVKKATKKGAAKYQFSESLILNNEKKIKESWNLNAAERLWSIQNDGLKFSDKLGFPKGELVSKQRFVGELAAEIIGRTERASTVTVRLCGESIDVKGPADVRIQILRKGNTLSIRNGGRDYTVTLKESWDDKPTDIRVGWAITTNTASSATIKSIGIKAEAVEEKEFDN